MNHERTLLHAAPVLFLFLALLLGACKFPGETAAAGGEAVPRLVIKEALRDVSALYLTITGPRMKPLEYKYRGLPKIITLEVPSGEGLQFEMTAYADGIGAARSYRGVATVDLKAGETTTIVLRMQLRETRLVIPDGNYHRIVQMDDMKGGGWAELSWKAFAEVCGYGADSEFVPYDIDFDNAGAIYVANNYATPTRLIRIDNIKGAGITSIPTKSRLGIAALAVDRANNMLYYIEDGGLYLYRQKLGGRLGCEHIIDLSGERIARGMWCTGMAVHENGLLYMAWTDGRSGQVVALNPDAREGSRVVTYLMDAMLPTPFDILVKGGLVYVSDAAGPKGVIIELREKLKPLAAFGVLNGEALTKDRGVFYGPGRFIGITPSSIRVTDDGYYDSGRTEIPVDRVVSFDDMRGANWTAFYPDPQRSVFDFPFIYEEAPPPPS